MNVTAPIWHPNAGPHCECDYCVRQFASDLQSKAVTTDEKLVADAKGALTKFVNAQACPDVAALRRCLACMEMVVWSAQNAVENGKMEKLS